MVYPVSGAVAQQIPAANTFQPGSTADAQKRTEQDSKINSAQTQNTDTTRAQRLNARDEEKASVQTSSNRTQDTGSVRASTQRGTTLDLSV